MLLHHIVYLRFCQGGGASRPARSLRGATWNYNVVLVAIRIGPVVSANVHISYMSQEEALFWRCDHTFPGLRENTWGQGRRYRARSIIAVIEIFFGDRLRYSHIHVDRVYILVQCDASCCINVDRWSWHRIFYMARLDGVCRMPESPVVFFP